MVLCLCSGRSGYLAAPFPQLQVMAASRNSTPAHTFRSRDGNSYCQP